MIYYVDILILINKKEQTKLEAQEEYEDFITYNDSTLTDKWLISRRKLLNFQLNQKNDDCSLIWRKK